MSTLLASVVAAPCTLAAGEEIAGIAVIGGLLLGLVAVISRGIRAHTREREREQSRREIAAYVAEGTMSAEDGAKLLNAGPKTPW